MPPFVLTSDRLYLRDYHPQDWKRVHLYASVPEFSKYELWGPNSIEDSKKFVEDMAEQATEEKRFKFDLAICLKANDLLIGGCGIRREGQYSCIANLGWAINPEFQGLGYATEAAQRLIQFGTDELRLKVIYATCDSRNVPSFRVMEKLGMMRVGHLKGDRIQKGYLRDTYRYELIPQ